MALTQIQDETKTDKTPLVPKHEALANVLSLYIQICEDGGTVEVLNLKGLAALTADIIIQNIYERLAERPADEARREVVVFYQKQDTRTNAENTCSGWLLLKSLSLLTATGSDVLSSLNPELPAALVKCLYLLVCLPPNPESVSLEQSFQESLTQVFLHLCRAPGNVEKLIETEEFQCLIIGLTSLWDQTSALWRHQASRVLKVVSASSTKNAVPSLLGKHCIRICIQNLLHIRKDVSGPLLAEVAVAVFSFIKDTYDHSPALFEVFDANNGYKVLGNILKCCEEGVPDDQFPPVEELIALIAAFIMFGKTELKVALCISNPQPPGFKFDVPLSTGSIVKNLPAFRLLQGSLLRSHNSRLCCQILQTMQKIWEKETANFFLLEWSTQTMTQLASCMLTKPAAVYKLYFSLLEMIIFKLNFIPHETLRAVLTVLKRMWTGATLQQTDFGVATVKCFHRLTVYSSLLTEVLSDWGLLKLLLAELRRRAKILIKAVTVTTDTSQLSHIDDNERLLTNYMLQVVSTFTLRSIKNTVSVRELGMVPYIKIFLNEDQYRDSTLSILEQLAEVNPEEFMSIAIGALCSSTQQEIKLKKDLLQSVLKVLENPNSWDAFRKQGYRSNCRFSSDSIILHPGAVRVIMTLLPLVFTLEDPQLSVEVQYSVVHQIQVMVKCERNRQIMCDGGLIAVLLTHCGKMLIETNHPLHLPVTRILEKLSSQSISLKDFRTFLCLGNPLMCLSGNMSQKDLSENVKTLTLMMEKSLGLFRKNHKEVL
ncbi:hypothetical protein WMY93_007212 [Mugilogobius chulae]|uniref:Uncharacterized protein n=1 Tax=Mugilogobius chulae TaxID=88201 RepID=A0AAW0PMJ9_9GOBI